MTKLAKRSKAKSIAGGFNPRIQIKGKAKEKKKESKKAI